jgi:beta-glucanase (GH16 family)
MPRIIAIISTVLCVVLGAFGTSTAVAKRSSRCHPTSRHHHRHTASCHRSKPAVHAATALTKARKGGGSGGGTTSGGTSTGCGGESLLAKPGGGTWTCSFDDEFDSTTGDPSSLNTASWTPQVTATSGYATGWPYIACYVNSPNNVSVSGGALHLTVRKEPAPFSCAGATTQYTSGMVSTIYGFNQTYGRFEIRAQLPPATVAGLQETLWLWPVNSKLYGSFPGSGEVDFSEFYSEYSMLDIPFIHYNYDKTTTDKTTGTNVVTNYCQIDPSHYNDYAVVWQPGSFTITINGTACLTDNYVPDNGLVSPAPFDQPFFIELTQALGIGTNAYDASSTPLPATTSIDYVRVWK